MSTLNEVPTINGRGRPPMLPLCTPVDPKPLANGSIEQGGDFILELAPANSAPSCDSNDKGRWSDSDEDTHTGQTTHYASEPLTPLASRFDDMPPRPGAPTPLAGMIGAQRGPGQMTPMTDHLLPSPAPPGTMAHGLHHMSSNPNLVSRMPRFMLEENDAELAFMRQRGAQKPLTMMTMMLGGLGSTGGPSGTQANTVNGLSSNAAVQPRMLTSLMPPRLLKTSRSLEPVYLEEELGLSDEEELELAEEDSDEYDEDYVEDSDDYNSSTYYSSEDRFDSEEDSDDSAAKHWYSSGEEEGSEELPADSDSEYGDEVDLCLSEGDGELLDNVSETIAAADAPGEKLPGPVAKVQHDGSAGTLSALAPKEQPSDAVATSVQDLEPRREVQVAAMVQN